MKKTLFAVMALMCMTLGLTACGGDDEPKQTVNAQATYQIDFSEDLVAVADISIVYIDNNGQVNIDKLAVGSRQWTKAVTCPIKEKSVNMGFKVVYALKSDELTKDNYELKAEAKIQASVPSSNRTFVETLMDTDVRKNKVAETIAKYNNKAFGINVNKSGSIEENTSFTVSI